MTRIRTGFTVALLVAAASALAAQQPRLGPKDGAGLPPTDTGRVKVGDAAPDFTLESLAGPVVSLSEFRGRKNVVLVFYRGHW
jgi:peroxiredoxin (alkyl hydroperoxide reductase subunit C)